MANITSNSENKPWYDDFTNNEYGMVPGLSNAALFGIVVGSLVAVGGIIGLIYHCKKKKDLEKQLKEKEAPPKENQVSPTGDIYDEIEGEIEKHEEQKKKLSMYLGYLLNKDGQGLMTANQKRMQAAARKATVKTNPWF